MSVYCATQQLIPSDYKYLLSYCARRAYYQLESVPSLLQAKHYRQGSEQECARKIFPSFLKGAKLWVFRTHNSISCEPLPVIIVSKLSEKPSKVYMLIILLDVGSNRVMSTNCKFGPTPVYRALITPWHSRVCILKMDSLLRVTQESKCVFQNC